MYGRCFDVRILCLIAVLGHRCADKFGKEGVGSVWSAFELGVELHADVERSVGQLDCFDKSAVGGKSREGKACRGQPFAVVVIELVAVAVALADGICTVAAAHRGIGCDDAGVCSKAQGAALFDRIALPRHKVDDLIFAKLVELAGICIGDAADVPCVLDNGYLHTKADAKEGYAVLTGIFHRGYHTVYTASAEAAGDYDAACSRKLLRDVFLRELFGIYPLYFDAGADAVPCVAECLGDRKIGIVKLGIFTDKGYVRSVLRGLDAADHFAPLVKLRTRCGYAKALADDLGKARSFKHKRCFVEVGQGEVLDDTILRYVAEKRYFAKDGRFKRSVAAQHDDVGIYTHALK